VLISRVQLDISTFIRIVIYIIYTYIYAYFINCNTYGTTQAYLYIIIIHERNDIYIYIYIHLWCVYTNKTRRCNIRRITMFIYNVYIIYYIWGWYYCWTWNIIIYTNADNTANIIYSFRLLLLLFIIIK